MHARKVKFLGLLLLLSLGVAAQSSPPPDRAVEIRFKAEEDQVEVGRPFEVSLEVEHPAEMVVIFPDTGGDFFPYELHSRNPLETRTENGRSVDKVFYKLYTWNIDSLQEIKLPIRYIQEQDTQLLFSNADTLLFVPTITTPIDSLQVKSNDELAPIAEPFPTSTVLTWVLLGLLIFGIGTLIFYRPVVNYLRRIRIEREWKRYFKRLQAIPDLSVQQEDYLGELSKVWKSYFDRDWGRGLGALSTRELKLELENMEHLSTADQAQLLQLNRLTDEVTYAGVAGTQTEVQKLYQEVSRIMEQEYLRRKEAVEL